MSEGKEHAENWSEALVRDFMARWHAVHGDSSAHQHELLQNWLETRLLAGSESFAGEESLGLVAEWNGEPTLVLIADDRLVLLRLQGMEIQTSYLGPLMGGTYEERWRWLEQENRFELELTFEHHLIPGALNMTFQTLKQIDQEAVEPMRERFRRWAEARPGAGAEPA